MATNNQIKLYSYLKNIAIPNVLIVENYKTGIEAERVFKYLQKNVYLLADFRAEIGDDLRSYRDELQQIGISLDGWFKNRGTLIIPIETASKPLPNKTLRENIKLVFGDYINRDTFFDKLEKMGYLETGAVLKNGEFLYSINRFDIFPFGYKQPYRISLNKFSEIEEIRPFSPFKQLRTNDEVEKIYISPLIFNVDNSRFLELEDDIKYGDFNSLSPDVNSFGLWFLNENERLFFKDFLNYSFLPPAKENYKNIEFEQIVQKGQTYEKISILLDELGIGDYVVHSDYGIGIFEGLSRENILGGLRDFLKIRYAGEQHLLLPIERLNLLSRYLSATGGTPKIDKMGSGSFIKRKNAVREQLETVAKYIVNLSAQRQLISAPKIENIDLSVIKKSSGFDYTLDQISSINTIMENISRGYPLDHLLIGDVGFGKTEVALNIIYAVAKSGFQTAFLVPTTLLARQHYLNISDRLYNLGIKSAHLDKFISLKDRKNIISQIANGEIDLIIGTTSILELKFNKLAFLIIDEEHKFGVKQKSQMQLNYSNIHSLSMSATPIPRTLHSALSQIKTISRLETPPQERKGVKTRVIEYDEPILKQAILRELKRGGQVFYIYNSIIKIDNKKQFLLNMLPHLKILILHSQVNQGITETEILRFEQGEYDLLLSTSIIGSGIHIPNANTIIVDGADRFGIADLHQLRGRVGRGEREGYSFFVIEKRDLLTESGTKRLLSLEENSHLGSGNILAMHDLEMRGGGNIAGESQSGHIDDIGYSLYVQYLEYEILKLTNNSSELSANLNYENINKVDIRLSIDGYISPKLVHDDRGRLDLYRRIADLKSIDDVNKIKFELIDRFGELDIYTEQYLEIIKIKILSDLKNVLMISNSGKKITLLLTDNRKIFLDSPTRDHDDILKTILNFLTISK